ncbi:magnesium transporter [Salinarimonas sp.]|uniref:magnesium transporter n=1 Tax=Salinarimonas sp. TaxID=2766526 RepID=UPI00391B7F0B
MTVVDRPSARRADTHPADIANEAAGLEPARAAALLAGLPAGERGAVFGYLPPEQQADLVAAMPRADLAAIFTEMSHDDRVDVFKRMSPAEQETLLPALAQAERDDIRRLAAYGEGTAGAVMTSDYATLAPDLSVANAFEALRREAPDAETIYEAYVVDPERRLLGVVSLRDLLLAAGTKRVSDVMRRDPVTVRASAPKGEAARKVADYDLIALPVLDERARLVGIVTTDDAMDVQAEEATREFRKIGGIQEGLGHKGGAVAAVTSVREASIFMLYRLRIVWLVVLVFGNIFSGAGIAAFEETIEAYVALVFFLPLLIDSGGNAGSQAATLMVRGLATGDVRMRDWSRMIGREVLVAGLLGLTMALAVSVIGVFRGGPEIALVVASSMVLIVLVGSTIGMSLPFLLSRLKLDPAAASAPLITSIADAAGVIIYFSIATTVLPFPEAG